MNRGQPTNWETFILAPDGLEWFQFMDMYSGGSLKEPPFSYIYVLASDALAARLRFESLFNHNPEDIGCDTCGENYSITCNRSLAKVSECERRRDNHTIEQHSKEKHILIVWDVP